MKDNYNFSKGERGKYAKQFAEDSNVIILDPELAKLFPTSEAVNKALWKLVDGKKKSPDRSEE